MACVGDLSTAYHDNQIHKWQPTGWRIEQKYSPGVLISNWYESSLGKFRQGTYLSGDSTNHDNYRQYHTSSYNPDVSTRRKGILRNAGLDKDYILTHHGDCYSKNRISSYDQNYIRKHTVGIRQWNLRRVAWLPEASDHPIQGGSTNFGLKEEKEEKNKKEREEMSRIQDLSTVYGLSYRYHPEGMAANRLATPRHLSSHLHPHNMHKDLHLRGSPLIVTPEVVDPRLLKLSATI